MKLWSVKSFYVTIDLSYIIEKVSPSRVQEAYLFQGDLTIPCIGMKKCRQRTYKQSAYDAFAPCFCTNLEIEVNYSRWSRFSPDTRQGVNHGLTSHSAWPPSYRTFMKKLSHERETDLIPKDPLTLISNN